MSMNGKMQLVLYGCKKRLSDFRFSVVIHGHGIDISDLLVKSPFTCANLTNFFKQVIKIGFIEERTIF